MQTRHLIAIFFLWLTPFVPAVAQEWVIEKLPPSINSPYDEITPVPSRDGSRLFFTRVAYPVFEPTLILDSINILDSLGVDMYRERLSWVYGQLGGTGHVADPARSPFNQDIWVATVDSIDFSDPIHPGAPLNNALPNSLVTITPEPNAYYIINQFKPNGDLKRGFSVIREQPDGAWSFPEPVQIDEYYTIKSDVNLTMSFDGEILILSATRNDSRDMDLYVCFRQEKYRWSAPRHLGNVVNSPGRETTPYLSEDNTTLFFSSNRASSIGGNDIFMCKRLDDTWVNWSDPVRLRSPINSPADDSQPYFNMSTGYLYLTSRRDGNSDIFRFQLAPAQPTMITLRGRILNSKTGQLIPHAELDYQSKWIPRQTTACPDGTFSIKVQKGIPYVLQGHQTGFAGKPDTIRLRNDYAYFQDQYVDIYLTPLQVGEKIELRPIYFQQSKAIILEHSIPELKRLAQFMSDNPKMHIRIEGHTDNVGKAEDLMRLSQDRAEAIKAFLLENKIAPERITAVGHGPKFPINDNSTEELKSLNRRVDVYITKMD